MNPTRRMPLFIITGASCVGKSTMCEMLFRNEEKYIVNAKDAMCRFCFGYESLLVCGSGLLDVPVRVSRSQHLRLGVNA
jgi:hypothetical protein